MSNSATSRTGRRTRGRRGASTLEFALVGAMFFITVLVALEVSRFFMTLQSMRNVVADAERWAMVNMSPGTLCGEQLFSAMGRRGLLGTNPNLCVTRQVTGAEINGVVTITVTLQNYTYPILVRVLGLTSVNLVENATFQYRR